MGIFNEPVRLAKLLASVNTHNSDRPLTPVETARWLKEAKEELGSKQEVMRRVDIGKSMWSAFENLLKISDEIESSICWGKSNSKKFQIGFSLAHYLAEGLTKEEQMMIVDQMWEENMDRPYTVDELKRIKSHHKSTGKPIDESIKHILKLDRPIKDTIYIFISGMKENIFENLKKKSKETNIRLDLFAAQILAKFFPPDTITNVKVRSTVIRVSFSMKGERHFKEFLKTEKISKNDIIEHIFTKAGFA